MHLLVFIVNKFVTMHGHMNVKPHMEVLMLKHAGTCVLFKGYCNTRAVLV